MSTEQDVSRLRTLWPQAKKVLAYIAAGLALFGIGHTDGTHQRPEPEPTSTYCQR